MKSKLMFFVLLHVTLIVLALENIEQNNVSTKVNLKIDLPIFDLPYQIDTNRAMGYTFSHTYTNPGMRQTLALTMGVYSSMHFGLKKMYDSFSFKPLYKDLIYGMSTAAGILGFAYVFPLGYPWMKHVYTHSIFNRYGIASYPCDGAGVTDTDLTTLKNDAPYDFIRMNVAGMEAYNLFSDRMMRNSFFYNLQNLSFVPALVTVFLNVFSMVPIILHSSGFSNYDFDGDVDSLYVDDVKQQNRDLAWTDSVNWVYELFRPYEVYTARGLHPSGDGSVARYIKISQLSDDERNYLVKQAGLHWLNYVSPLLYGYRSFALGKSGLEGNFALRHYLTSFGADIPVSIFLKYNNFNIAFSYHNYMNYQNYFAAVEAELIDYPLNIGKFGMYLSPRVMIGAQPKGQEFKTSSPEFFGLLGLRADFKVSKHVLPYFDVSAKTDGWIAGNEYLTSNVSMQAGVSLRF